MTDRKEEDMGIIPADAGSTDMVYAIFPPYRDHPRGCGEHGWKSRP